MLEMVYDQTTTTALKFINIVHNLVISYVKLINQFMGLKGLENLLVEHNSRIRLYAWVCGLAEFMFSDRYHLTGSALARVCPLMMVLVLWITYFNHCRTSLLLLLLNIFLKVGAMYFKTDSATSSVF